MLETCFTDISKVLDKFMRFTYYFENGLGPSEKLISKDVLCRFLRRALLNSFDLLCER